ncbi:MAG: DUF6544 family protein [Pseudomonadota bacterium]
MTILAANTLAMFAQNQDQNGISGATSTTRKRWFQRRGPRIAMALTSLFIAGIAGTLTFNAVSTRAHITSLENAMIEGTAATPGLSPAELTVRIAGLPVPVQRYFRFVFPQGMPDGLSYVEMEMEGMFRRPLTEGFAPTTGRQVIDLAEPNLVFSADTTIVWPLWAIAYDSYTDGEMEMKARVLSTLTVVDEVSTPSLNRTSLRRWLLESPVYPMALLPGGPVRWEPVDDNRARAIVSAFGEQASLVATFDERGALTRFDAEQDGDLTTPYHGSGEHVARGDYRMVQGMQLPHSFTIARAAGGEILPFWEARITSLRFE